MARIRSVHPDICVDEVLAEVTASAERTFVRLWTHLDDEGRCVDNPKLIKAALYPLHDDMTAELVDYDLNELARHGLIWRYEAEGKRCLSAKPGAWGQRQKPKHPTPSKLPAPPEGYTPPPEPPGKSSPTSPPNGVSPTPGLPPPYPEPGEDVPGSLHGVVGGEGVGDGGGEGVGGGVRGGGLATRPPDPDARRLCDLLADCIGQRSARRPKVTTRWLTDMDRLLRIDSRDPADVQRVISWLHNAPDDVARFWQPNVRSPGKLRDRWDQMSEQYRNRRRRPTDDAWEGSRHLAAVADPDINPLDSIYGRSVTG